MAQWPAGGQRGAGTLALNPRPLPAWDWHPRFAPLCPGVLLCERGGGVRGLRGVRHFTCREQPSAGDTQ